MAKQYTFEFPGTKEMFLMQIKGPDDRRRIFYIDDYIVELSENEIRFGVARGGHSGGYWFIPTITEFADKITFCGTIKYIDPYTNETGIKRIINKIEEAFLFIIFLPVLIFLEVCFFFSCVVRRILKKPIPKQETNENRLCNLMENHLGCKRVYRKAK